LDWSVGESERRVAPGFPEKIPMKTGCKPALQLFFLHPPANDERVSTWIGWRLW